MGAFSVFFMQDVSFLSHQKRLSKGNGNSNFTNLFGGIKNIPSANQIRNILDKIPANKFKSLFSNALNKLKEAGGLKQFNTKNGYLIALDGTEYQSSNKIHCSNCNSRTHNNTTTYYHSMLAAAIVSPDIKEVIALNPEFIIPQDGHKKQDCENTAIKRWLTNNGEEYKKLNATILGDDLFSREPICRAILEAGFNFILVCKPSSHKTIMSYIDGIKLEKITCERKKKNKKKYQYEYQFINSIPVKDSDDALLVNYLEVKEIDKKTKKITYRNGFITNQKISKENVEEMAKNGRARWKIENENNNTLKTKGYNFEHNYGHGKNHLSSVFAILTVIAFLYHTILNLCDTLFIRAKESQYSRQLFYNMVKFYTRLLLFDSWQSLLNCIIEPPKKLKEIII